MTEFDAAKLDSSKTIIAGVSTDTQDLTGIRLLVGIKGGPAAPPTVLTVVRAGNGSGTVTSNPAGINCGATCSAPFYGVLPVTLTANPAVGSDFTGWSGDCTGTGTCTVFMNQAHTVIATFTLHKFALSVAAAGNGSGTVSPLAVGSSTLFDFGTVVTPLTATPAADSDFIGWSGGGCSGTGTCTVTVTGTTTVTATFNLKQFALTVTKAGNGSGGVTSTPVGVNCGLTCSPSFNIGTSVTLTATPATGSAFLGWSGACTGTGVCSVTMTAARSVTATFERKAALTSPTPGSTFTGPSATFTWSAATGATEYILWVGTTAGHNQLYSKTQGLGLSVTVKNLPANGGPVFVRLFTRFGTTLLFTDYTFTAAP